MKVGDRELSGKGAGEDAVNTPNAVVMPWRGDKAPPDRSQSLGVVQGESRAIP